MTVSKYKYPFCVFVATHKGDYRLAKVCVESVRYFYNDLPIVILQDGDFDISQLLSINGVELWNDDYTASDILPLDQIKGAFAKLKLFTNTYAERYLYLDADIVLVGPIMDLPYRTCDFLMIPAYYNVNDPKSIQMLKRYQFDLEKIQEYDPNYRANSLILYSTGMWFGRSGVIAPQVIKNFINFYLLQTGEERKRVSAIYEQGLISYLVSSGFLYDTHSVVTIDCEIRPSVERQRTKYPDLNLSRVKARNYKKFTHLHYTSPRRNAVIRAMNMGEIPLYFNQLYYYRFSKWVQWKDNISNLPIYWRQFKNSIYRYIRKIIRHKA